MKRFALSTTRDIGSPIPHYPPREIAVRFSHRLVAIHPFPNGSGDFRVSSAIFSPVSARSRPLRGGG